MQIAAGDIEGICRAWLKADAAAALDPSDRQAAAAAVRGLQRVAEEAEASGYGIVLLTACRCQRGTFLPRVVIVPRG